MSRPIASALAALLALPSLSLAQANPQAGPVSPAAPAAAPAGPPRAPRRPVVDRYHGVEVTDPYRWLEDPKDPEVQAWTEGQTAAARRWLDGAPHATAIRAQVADIILAQSVAYYGLVDRPNGLFAFRRDPARQQPLLVLLRSPDAPGQAREVIDPNRLDPSGKTALDFFVPSLDGKKVLASLSVGGTESGDLHVFDVATGKPIGQPIARVFGGTAGGGAAWNGDGTGFWYTRYPRAGERPAEDLAFHLEVWFHRLGAPESADRRDLMAELPRIAEIELATKRDGKWVIAEVKNGDGGEVEYFVRPTGKGGWTQLSTFEDQVVGAAFGEGRSLFLLTRQGTPRGRVLTLALPPPAGRPLDAARQVLPQGDGAIQAVLPTRSRLYVSELVGGLSRLRFTGLDGQGSREVPILPVSSVEGLVRSGADDLLFDDESYTEPYAWYRYVAKTGAVARTALAVRSPVDLSEVEALRGFATSRDGTRVPVDVLRRRGLPLDAAAPTILYGYGGYGVSQTPSFNALRGLWLLNGGVCAFASIRGGGEYGDEWHLAGNLTHKQNGFDDFLAAERWLVEERYTRPDRLGILGASNGGLLMGAALTQRPDQVRAVVDLVGIADMLRVESTPNGAFNVTEFGTVKDEAQFKALLAYSPVHAVKAGTAYPSVLLTAGENDPRVDAWHAKKLAAALQDASTSGRPVLLKVTGWGHGMGSSRDARIEDNADRYTFFATELGLAFQPVPIARPAAP